MEAEEKPEQLHTSPWRAALLVLAALLVILLVLAAGLLFFWGWTTIVPGDGGRGRPQTQQASRVGEKTPFGEIIHDSGRAPMPGPRPHGPGTSSEQLERLRRLGNPAGSTAPAGSAAPTQTAPAAPAESDAVVPSPPRPAGTPDHP